MTSPRWIFLAMSMLLLFLTLSVDEAVGSRRRSSRGRKKGNEEDDDINNIFSDLTTSGGSGSSSKAANVTRGSNRRGKFFSLFNVVQFANDPCSSSATLLGGNGNRNGTCFTVTECADKGGNAQGNCAAGFGVCCVFTVTSDNGNTEVNQNCTYIQNPGFPSSTTNTAGITYTINRCSPDVCQLRLDFELFTLQGVGGTAEIDEGVCTDTFVATGTANQNVPVICGENTGQHIYVDAIQSNTVTFTFDATIAASRQWDIKVTQVECTNANSAPAGCLQYHTTLTGRLTTFNFSPMAENHLNDQQYSICIRPELGFCCVQYMVCPDVTNPFTLDTNMMTAMQDNLCLTVDYVGISNSGATCNQGNNLQVDSRYCGLALSTFNMAAQGGDVPICDCTAPFIVDIFTNGLADGQTATGMMNTNTMVQSRGVCLDYMQIPCNSS